MRGLEDINRAEREDHERRVAAQGGAIAAYLKWLAGETAAELRDTLQAVLDHAPQILAGAVAIGILWAAAWGIKYIIS